MKPVLTHTAIWAAMDAILADGRTPTLRLIRDTVGHGSFSTIHAAVVERRALQLTQGVLSEPPPVFLEERLEQLASELWAAACSAGTKRLVVEREALDHARAAMEAALQEAVELADVLTLDVEQTQSALAQSQAAEQAMRAEATEMRLQLSATQARCAELDRHATQLQQECKSAREAEAQARERVAELTGRLQTVEAQNQDLMKTLSRKG